MENEEFKSQREFSEYINNVFSGEIKADGGIIAPNVFVINTIKDGSKIGEVLGKDVINPFKIEQRKYSIFEDKIWEIIRPFRSVLLYEIIGFITRLLQFNSNVIRFSYDSIRGYSNINYCANNISSCINLLENYNIIRRTNIKSIYLVNPLMIYKGNINNYINKIRNNDFDNPIVENKKVIIDKVAIYENVKDEIPRIIKSKNYLNEEDKLKLKPRKRRGVNNNTFTLKINLN